MLTKDLLKFRTRKGKLFPDRIDLEDIDQLKIADDMIKILNSSEGCTKKELETKWENEGLDLEKSYPGFKKLLCDKIEWHELEDSWEDNRWKLLLEAQQLRDDTLFPSFLAFQEAFASQNSNSFEHLSQSLYGDLPEYKRIKANKEISGSSLINLYNCAQIQGLLLRARHLDLTVIDASVEDKRNLFRSLKFHQIIAEDLPQAKNLRSNLDIRLSGPLSVLDNAQSYGARLANFFPRILHLDHWKLSAEISMPPKKGNFYLELDSEMKIQSTYQLMKSYIPEEFQIFLDLFNKSDSEWHAKSGESFFNLGKQSYCFPDICFTHSKGDEVHLELFHKWHKGALEQRVELLKKNPARNLLLGVHKNLLKNAQFKEKIQNSQWFKEQGFAFLDMPSVKSVHSILSRLTAI